VRVANTPCDVKYERAKTKKPAKAGFLVLLYAVHFTGVIYFANIIYFANAIYSANAIYFASVTTSQATAHQNARQLKMTYDKGD
jgi:hypothetical protein